MIIYTVAAERSIYGSAVALSRLFLFEKSHSVIFVNPCKCMHACMCIFIQGYIHHHNSTTIADSYSLFLFFSSFKPCLGFCPFATLFHMKRLIIKIYSAKCTIFLDTHFMWQKHIAIWARSVRAATQKLFVFVQRNV